MFARALGNLRVTRSMATLPLTEAFPHASHAATPGASVIKQTVLANGAKVITRNNAHSLTASVRVAVVGGTRAETYAQKGSAHLLAATAFSGTGKRSGIRLLRDLDNVGAQINAGYSREAIHYDASVMIHDDNAEEVASALLEIVSSAPKHDYTVKESHHLLELKYASATGCNHFNVSELLHEAAFGERAPLAAKLAESTHKVTEEGVQAYRRANFVSKNVVVAATGVDHDKLVKIVEQQLSTLPAATPVVSASPYVGGEVRVRKDLHGKTFLAVGFPFAAADSKNVEVLRNLLQSKGFHTFFNNYSTGGLWGFYSAGQTDAAVAGLQAAVAGLKAATATSSVDAAVTAVSLDKTVTLEGAATATAALVDAAVANVSTAALTDYSSVTAASVSAAAAASLATTPSLAVLGTTFGVPTYTSVVSWLK